VAGRDHADTEILRERPDLTMASCDYLIVGGGLAAVSAVEGIRREDGDGTVVMLCEEEEPPYHRPPLSKEYLQTPEASRDLLHVKPEEWYEQADVQLALGTRATGLDARQRKVHDSDGETWEAERILLATGGRPRRLGVEGESMEGVHTLRGVADAEAIRKAASRAEAAVLVGAGFIGMELAASLRAYDVAPTVVELGERPWPQVLPPALSEFVQAYFEDRGVAFRCEAGVSGFRGEGRVEAVTLDDGTEVPCDMAVVAVGIGPSAELAAEAGLAVHDGIEVDRFGETSHGYIYAAGDVARYPDPVFGDTVRMEHWDHARAHGRAVGRNMAGAKLPYDHVSYFFSDAFDLSFNVFGRPSMADRIVVRGELGAKGSLVFCGHEGRLCAAVLVNENESMDECRELVRRRPSLDEIEEELSDPEADLAGIAG
jgi:NADPH-dependent 2,4-dienoyl-CoA reductase/sulfur reductase-like enzyme